MTPKEIFNRKVDSLVRGIVRPKEWESIKHGNETRAKGLNSARQGLFALSKRQLTESRRTCERLSIGSAFQIQEAFQLAAEAYLHYKTGNPDRAVQLLDIAYGIDAALIRTEKYGIMSGHAVQLMVNKIRVAKKFGSLYNYLTVKKDFVATMSEALEAESFLGCVLDDETTLVISQIVLESLSDLDEGIPSLGPLPRQISAQLLYPPLEVEAH
jgi:hypothetical protein